MQVASGGDSMTRTRFMLIVEDWAAQGAFAVTDRMRPPRRVRATASRAKAQVLVSKPWAGAIGGSVELCS